MATAGEVKRQEKTSSEWEAQLTRKENPFLTLGVFG